MTDTVFLIFELIGTVAFAVSGAITALEKKMDFFGVIILGLTTAIGGGVIRDVILGITPPSTFSSPIYAVTAIVTSIIVFFPMVRRVLQKRQKLYGTMLLLMDSIGLGVFTTVGIHVAIVSVYPQNVFLLVFVGIVTGVGGGVLRDIFACDTPYIFVKHFYACASLIGAVVCVAIYPHLGQTMSMLIGTVIIVILRLCAAHFNWSLPKPRI